jgi:hypothetical protein
MFRMPRELATARAPFTVEYRKRPRALGLREIFEVPWGRRFL